MKPLKILSYSILIGGVMASAALAQPPLPVNQITLSQSEQQALKTALPQDTETVMNLVWQGNPLSLTLPLHEERRLVFPEPVQVDVSGQLNTDQLRIINDHQNVYLTALTAFLNKARIYVTLKNSGRIIFIDLSTTDQINNAAAQVIQITVPTARQPVVPTVQINNELSQVTDLSYEPVLSASADEWIHAIRFAWQQLYAPSYLLSDDNNFIRSPLHSSFWVSGLFYSDTVFVHPLISWTQDNLVITAVELRNPYPHSVTVDLPHDLCGHWRAAALYPRKILQPIGDKSADSTTLFLISSEPFHQALGGCEHGRA